MFINVGAGILFWLGEDGSTVGSECMHASKCEEDKQKPVETKDDCSGKAKENKM